MGDSYYLFTKHALQAAIDAFRVFLQEWPVKVARTIKMFPYSCPLQAGPLSAWRPRGRQQPFSNWVP